MRTHDSNVNVLIGLTLASAVQEGSDTINLVTTEGRTFRFYHEQDCCESVNVDSIKGDLDWLLGSPITRAEEVIDNTNPPDYVLGEYGQDSFTWTTYTFATVKGTVVIRWYGSSNGYYSESVSFIELAR